MLLSGVRVCFQVSPPVAGGVHSLRCQLEQSKCSVSHLRVPAPVAVIASVAAALLCAHDVHAQDVLIFDHDQSLARADFSNRKDLVGAIFTKSNCAGANFSHADLRNAQLDDTNVSI